MGLLLFPLPWIKNWRQCSFGADLSQQVADAVVAVNEISILRAACGVVAKNIDGLHAQRTTDFFSQNWDTQTNEHSNLKIAGSHNCVFTGRRGSLVIRINRVVAPVMSR